MAEEAVVPGYDVGKEIGWSTPHLFGAGISFGISFLMILPLVSAVRATGTDNATVAHAAVVLTVLVVFLVLGVWATIAHRRDPKSKATVVRTVKNCNGLYSAELRFLDGSTIEHNLGLALPLNKQFAGFTKSVLTGK